MTSTPQSEQSLTGKVVVITGAEIPVDGGLTAHGGVKSVSDAMRPQAPDVPGLPTVGVPVHR